ncbi:MAG: KUP/HAK/KT family potassium transporter [Deltaproteobacteria bacterium]|nr:KUP/HAK/KT family potassium transporter [Deltaproteobacteria bacterium]
MAEAGRDARTSGLALAALGVVFGDIGTSPLYAMHVCFAAGSGLTPTPANVLGVLSLIVWALLLVVTAKYVLFVMRADLNGEGGILALMTLATRRVAPDGPRRRLLLALGLIGAALLYGDGMLTPAISVLSAVEGVKIATPLFVPFIAPLTVAVLALLFWFQRRGSGAVGAVFGPVMLLWFVVLALLGLRWIPGAPEVLTALSPHHGARFLLAGGWSGYLILGSVFLAVTGGEALYADIGHFGTRPIRRVWLAVVLPAVLINYFGQAAMLLQDPTAIHHTFFQQAPQWALVPLVILATAAAVIASQAVIAGAFSLTAQAVELGYAPRTEVRHASADEEGQVYVPLINWLLFAAAVWLVLHFCSSDALAGAYGVAVAGTMALTTWLAVVHFSGRWGWAAAALFGVAFLPIDLAFLGANLVKIDHGGWFPLTVAALGYLLFNTWMRGQQLSLAALERMAEGEFRAHVAAEPPARVRGTAVFFTRSGGLPRMLWHHVALTHALHKLVVVLTVQITDEPRVADTARLQIAPLGDDLVAVTARYGYMQRPNVPRVLREVAARGVAIDFDDVTYILARTRIVYGANRSMALWRKRLYAFLARNAYPATANYRLPRERVLELGVQVEI